MLEIKNTVTEMKNVFKFQILQCEEKKRMKKVEEIIQELWDNYKRCNIS